MRASRGRIVTVCVLVGLSGSLPVDVQGAPLDEWILQRIQDDEGLLRSAALATDGRGVSLLGRSTTYVPFFLESPALEVGSNDNGKESLSGFFEQQKPTFLAGGYLYRITFKSAPTLYALSTGEWDGTQWYSPALGKDVEIDPLKVWQTAGGDSGYASLLSGAPPRLVVYGRDGALKTEQKFDLNDPDLIANIDSAIEPYSRFGDPNLEMISLEGFLRKDDSAWSQLRVSSSYNLRNQEERPEEKQRFENAATLTRAEAVRKLQARIGGAAERPPGGGKPELVEDRRSDPAPTSDENTGSRFPLWLILAGALLLALIAFVSHKTRG